jgi:hypothetical protein
MLRVMLMRNGMGVGVGHSLALPIVLARWIHHHCKRLDRQPANKKYQNNF